MGSPTVICPNCGVPNWEESEWCIKCDDKLPPFAPVITISPKMGGKTDADTLRERHIIKY